MIYQLFEVCGISSSPPLHAIVEIALQSVEQSMLIKKI